MRRGRWRCCRQRRIFASLQAPRRPNKNLNLGKSLAGVLVQQRDLLTAAGDNPDTWKLVAGPAASPELLRELEFAWRAVRAVKSNAILLAKDGATVGVGMGQVNRVDAAKLAVERANTLAGDEQRAVGSWPPRD